MTENQKNSTWLRTFPGSIAIIMICAFAILQYREFLLHFHLPMTLSTMVYWGILLLIPFVRKWVIFTLLSFKSLSSIAFILSSPRGVSINGIISNIVHLIAGILFAIVIYAILDGLKRANSKLEYEKNRANEASKAKAAFLANMSHEIRTPLSGIRGITEMMLSQETLDSQNKDNLHLIHSSSETLLELVNTILNFSRIESGKETINRGSCSLEKMLDQVKSSIAPSIDKPVVLNTVIDPSLPTIINTDPIKVKQIILNLVSNGVKFTDVGSVTVSIKKKSETRMTITVHDTGIGIPEDHLSLIFSEFERVQTSYDKYREGTGLGLAITKRLVELLDGTITVKSEIESGTTFIVELPFESAVKESSNGDTGVIPTVSPSPKESANLSVLVAEDNKVNQIYLKHFLEKQGFDLTLVENGEEAVQQFQNNAYSVVLMDIQMPVKSGLQAAEEIRQYEKLHSRVKTPILALTASVTDEEQKLFLSSGMDAVCPKPVDMKQLLKSIETHARVN